MIIRKPNGTLNVQLCSCEALPPYPPNNVVAVPEDTSVLSVKWDAPDQSNGRAITDFIVVCDDVEDIYASYNSTYIYVSYNSSLDEYYVPIDNLPMSGAEYVIQIISIGPLHESSEETVTQRTSKL